MRNISRSIALLALSLIFVLSSKAQNYNTKSTLTGTKSTIVERGDKKTPSKKSGVENVIIVYKTHFDIGYSETAQQVVHDYRTSMADRVLDAKRGKIASLIDKRTGKQISVSASKLRFFLNTYAPASYVLE
jgi:hypothetical protein